MNLFEKYKKGILIGLSFGLLYSIAGFYLMTEDIAFPAVLAVIFWVPLGYISYGILFTSCEFGACSDTSLFMIHSLSWMVIGLLVGIVISYFKNLVKNDSKKVKTK